MKARRTGSRLPAVALILLIAAGVATRVGGQGDAEGPAQAPGQDEEEVLLDDDNVLEDEVDTDGGQAGGQLAVEDDTQWYLVWQDSFSGRSGNVTTPPDARHWSFSTGWGCEFGYEDLCGVRTGNDNECLCGWGNQELQTYAFSRRNVRQDGGRLIIQPQRESSEVAPNNWFTSGRLRSLNKVWFSPEEFHAPEQDLNFSCSNNPGLRVDVRVRVGPGGPGLWPAVWMLPNSYPGLQYADVCSGCGPYGTWPISYEIDILETRNELDIAFGTMHHGGEFGWNNVVTQALPVDDSFTLVDTWHTWGIEWFRNGTLFWTLDGQRYHQASPCDMQDALEWCCARSPDVGGCAGSDFCAASAAPCSCIQGCDFDENPDTCISGDDEGQWWVRRLTVNRQCDPSACGEMCAGMLCDEIGDNCSRGDGVTDQTCFLRQGTEVFNASYDGWEDQGCLHDYAQINQCYFSVCNKDLPSFNLAADGRTALAPPPMHLLMNVAVGGKFTRYCEADFIPQCQFRTGLTGPVALDGTFGGGREQLMEVDYVQVSSTCSTADSPSGEVDLQLRPQDGDGDAVGGTEA